ncbi:MAG: hypothetical protein L6R28_16335 [Planctomycetes bacterium]|nr:hypothetical protein [Planctomycetota bacterium]
MRISADNPAARHPAEDDGQPEYTLRELEDGTLCFTLTGAMSLEKLTAAGAEILAECMRRGCRRAVADARAMTGDLAIFDWHRLATAFEHTWTRTVSLAIVDNAERLKPDRFLETTARNRGIDVMVFSDLDAALAWLQD